MNHLFKRFLVNKKLSHIKTVFRSIAGAEQPKNDHNYNNNRSHNSQKIFYGIVGVTTVTVTGIGLNFFLDEDKNIIPAFESQKHEDIPAGEYMPDLRTYTYDEIISHKTKDHRIWVIYKEGVYDITDFVESHPGGEVILRAAGGSIEPFWTVYGIHKSNEVYEMLECLRIGNVSKEDSKKLTRVVEDPYFTDPVRDKGLIPSSEKPFNAEPSPTILTDKFYTPNNVFYVRNHLPVPIVDLKTYTIEIEVEGMKKKLSLSYDDLKKFKKHDVVSTIMCAGNRRSEMSSVREVKGLSWGPAAVGNAVWSGVYLRDVLDGLGVTDESKYDHIQFEGLDVDPNIEGRFYGGSVPFNYAIDKNREVLLAYEMNGEPLSSDHGFPVRVIVPGVCGARNVKWLKKIIVSNKESQIFWQQNDYKSFNSSTTADQADYSKASAIQALPVTSAICSPQNEEEVKPNGGYITVKGYAYSGGGSKILRVDVTADEGTTWFSANLESTDNLPPHHYGWTLWTVKVPVGTNKKEVELWAKAMDSNHNTQPETFEHIWNMRGVLSNAYHRIKVHIK